MTDAFGIWSDELACFVRVADITKSPIQHPLAGAVIAFDEREPAAACRRQIAELTGYRLDKLHVLALKSADRPEPSKFM